MGSPTNSWRSSARGCGCWRLSCGRRPRGWPPSPHSTTPSSTRPSLLATVSLQASRDHRGARALSERRKQGLPHTAYGKRILAREAEVRSAAESLSQLKEPLTREAVLDLILQAPSEERQGTLASLARPAPDYAFFQALSERIDRAEAPEKARLAAVRQRLLQ